MTDSSEFRLDVYSSSGEFLASDHIDKVSGAYETGEFPTQPVTLRVYYEGDRIDVLLFDWIGGGLDQSMATVFPTVDGVNSLEVNLTAPGTIAGTVSVSGAGDFGEIEILVSAAVGMTDVHFATVTEAAPNFHIGPFAPGTYTLTFSSSGMWEESPVAVTILAYGDDVVQNVTLERAAAIEGSVTVDGLIAGPDHQPYVYLVEPESDNWHSSAEVEPDGSYQFLGVEPGQYRVCVLPLVSMNWKPACAMDGSAERIFSVVEGGVIAGADISTIQWGGIVGSLKVGTSTSSSAYARLFVEGPDGYVYVASSGTVGIDGEYRFGGIEPGTYVLEFSHSGGMYSREYWQDERYFANADPVTVVAGPSLELGESSLSPRTYDTLRLAGPDRFATAVRISQELFPDELPDVPVIYVANGLNYPDALAAGPAASYLGGGLLLVTPTSIPEIVAAELERLQPDRIVVVGGTPAINADVEEALGDYSSDVDRIGGDDRFETSRMVVEDAWGTDTSEHAFIATGLNYPDALAAVPAAGVRGAPIILVPGQAATLDTATRNLITGLGVSAIHIVGSSAAVSAGIENSVRTLVGPENYVRYAGPDRFITAVLVSIGSFGVADNAFVATGLGFADALAGGPLAAATGSPMYLSNGTCLYDYVMSDIEAVGANRVVLLGSAAVLSTNVYNLGVCAASVSGEPVQSPFRLPEGVVAE